MTVLLYTQLTNSPAAIGNRISLCCLANGVIPEARRAVRDPLEEHRGARPGSGSNANWHHPHLLQRSAVPLNGSRLFLRSAGMTETGGDSRQRSKHHIPEHTI